ncbi:IPT/TIG domain-containing protein [Sphingobacterium sp. UBA5996]|uniref:IPT/TIG domain-containing protein n=1 Tax=Sphingobacterium sp. UBA5996 TaxID=1947505 RepID=UPI0025E2FB78|nr:IPT/TIG domain-containing protein [Sphingobacterium sp. UBA5996]
MNCNHVIKQITRRQTIAFLCSILIFITVSCVKEETVVPPDNNPTEVVILTPESNAGNNLILAAEVRYLNNSDAIQSHGFLIEKYSDETPVKKEYAITTSLQSGRITFKVPDPEHYKEGDYYTCKYFVRTEKGLYYSQPARFLVSSLRVKPKEDLTVVVGEIITVDGEFGDAEKNYGLYYGYVPSEEQKVPFELINSGKSIRFKVPAGIEQGNNATFRLIGKEKNGGQLSVIVAQGFILATLVPPAIYTYYVDENLQLPSSIREYNDNARLQVFVGNVFLKYSNYLRLYDFVKSQKGKTFPIGYTNGRDTITFPQPLQLKEADPDEFKMIPEYVHPGTNFEVVGPDPGRFDFYGYATVGNKKAYYLLRDNTSKKGELAIDDIPDGEYSLEMKNSFFSYTSNNKIKVKSVHISSSSHTECYAGDKIKLKGTFILRRSYGLRIDPAQESYFSTCNTSGEIIFEVPATKAGNYQAQVTYLSEMGQQKNYYSNAIPLQVKATVINSVSPLRATAGTLITIEGHGLNGYKVRIADREIQHTLSQNDKIQFKVPDDLPKGKYRVNARFFNYVIENVVFASDYLEIL